MCGKFVNLQTPIQSFEGQILTVGEPSFKTDCEIYLIYH